MAGAREARCLSIPVQRLGPVPAVAAATCPSNTVLHGDCIEVMAGLPAECVDSILIDPPYLCRYRDRSGRTIANDNNPRWLKPAFAEAYRVLRPNSLCVSFYGWNAADQFLGAWRAAGFRIVGHLVFAKTCASSTRFVAAQHECAYILAKGRPPVPSEALPDVLPWQYTGNQLHPTQRPVEPLRTLIDAFCPASGLVLDPFCGSGSTLVAAVDCGRNWLGVELDVRHAIRALRRLNHE
ncbi:DNA methylase [Mesorhizobium huakuii]|uniref:Methyltransferase n=2 Tax=Mesorhizobium huakuii TaxID=28104 RepID=A0A7G6T3W8_9HYPH|nr:DNA methylase [Mesorhizobium huakuii]